jgi:hypothetical protein
LTISKQATTTIFIIIIIIIFGGVVNLSSLQIGKSYTSQAFGTHMVVSFIMLKPEPF